MDENAVADDSESPFVRRTGVVFGGRRTGPAGCLRSTGPVRQVGDPGAVSISGGLYAAAAAGIRRTGRPWLAGLIEPLFRVDGVGSSALLLGLVGGYPIGPRTTAELRAVSGVGSAKAERYGRDFLTVIQDFPS